jgi:hypothetical protein
MIPNLVLGATLQYSALLIWLGGLASTLNNQSGHKWSPASIVSLMRSLPNKNLFSRLPQGFRSGLYPSQQAWIFPSTQKLAIYLFHINRMDARGTLQEPYCPAYLDVSWFYAATVLGVTPSLP